MTNEDQDNITVTFGTTPSTVYAFLGLGPVVTFVILLGLNKIGYRGHYAFTVQYMIGTAVVSMLPFLIFFLSRSYYRIRINKNVIDLFYIKYLRQNKISYQLKDITIATLSDTGRSGKRLKLVIKTNDAMQTLKPDILVSISQQDVRFIYDFWNENKTQKQ
jgi:hypothetical protein